MSGRLAGKRILVVEDEYYIASDLKRALLDEQATVVGPVGELIQGLALLDGAAIDCALLDVNLDGTMTYPIADRLAADGVPWVFVTGYDDWSLPDVYGDVPRIGKPFAAHAVVDSIVELVAKTSA